MKKNLFLFGIVLACLFIVKNIAFAYTSEYKNNVQGVKVNRSVTTATLGTLPAGAYVVDKESVWKFRYNPKYSGEVKAEIPVVWQKIEDNHYASGTTLMLSRDIVARYDWCLFNYWKAWDESFARNFLRTTFYDHLSEKFKNAIVEVQIPFIDSKGIKRTVQDNFFLLSVAEWGALEQAPQQPELEYEGKILGYEDLPSIYGAKEVNYMESWKYYSIADSPQSTITRTIQDSQNKYIYKIGPSGYIHVTNAVGGYIRPAVNLKSSTVVMGPYEFKDFVDGKKTFHYYVIQ